MSQLTIDDSVVALLSSVKGEATLLDKSGKVIGRFRRTMSPEEMAARNPFTLEDLEAARRDPAAKEPGESLSDFWDRVRRGQQP